MVELGEMDLEQAAKKAVGNWRRFDSFAWFHASELNDADERAIIYTCHRDSSLMAQSNAAVIEKALEPFMEGDVPEVIAERHSHWAVGWIDGYSIRVFDGNGQVTDAFRAYHELEVRMADYPLLDETDYSDREFESTLENIGNAAWRLKREYELPEGWEGDVFSWFWEHNQCAVENVDDQGGWPDEADLREAFDALGYPQVE